MNKVVPFSHVARSESHRSHSPVNGLLGKQSERRVRIGQFHSGFRYRIGVTLLHVVFIHAVGAICGAGLQRRVRRFTRRTGYRTRCACVVPFHACEARLEPCARPVSADGASLAFDLAFCALIPAGSARSAGDATCSVAHRSGAAV